MAIRMQQRRGTASQWTSGNPTLAAGEIGFETDTGKFKIGNGTSNWADLKYFTDANSILGGISGTDLPATLDTLNELAAALNDDPNFFSTIATNLSNHEADTQNIHGIADTSALATKTYADNAVSTHDSDTTGVHGIADTSALATKSGTEVFTNKTISYANNTITVQVNNISDLTASAAELNKLDGVTASTAEINTLVGLTASSSELNILDGATLSTTELNYVDGVTSAIQTQLDAKLASSTAASTYAPIASPTFTGTVSGVTKSMVGLGNVDNTSDANKPVSTATQTALDAKLALAGGTMTGALTLSGAPTSALHAATKQYVDDVTAGLNFHEAVKVATTANIAGTYSNGTAGVGATITVTATGVLTIDGVATALDDRILVKDQTTATQNGIYKVTTAGATGVSAVLTRATDADNSPDGELKTGDFVFATSGTVNGGYGFVNNTSGSITIGTTNVSYTSFNTAQAVSAGTGLTESTPGTLAIDSTVVTLTGTQTLTNKTLTAPTITGTIALPSTTSIGNVSDTEISYLDGVTSAVQTQIDAKTPELYTFTADSGTARTLALGDKFASLRFTSATAVTVTVPTNASVAFPVGSYIELYQWGAGQVSVAAATPATTSIRSTDSQVKLRTQYSSAVLIKVATDEWLLTGDLTA